MQHRHTRRNVLYGVATVAAAGGVVAAGSPAGAAEAPAWRIGTVTGVRRDAVQVDGAAAWLVLEGFPQGWQAIAGDLVAIARSANGPGKSANPLVHWEDGVAEPDRLRPGRRIAGGISPRIVEATILAPEVVSEGRRSGGTPTALRFAVADRATRDGSERVLAVHKA